MCRWLGYLGDPIEPRALLYGPERSLIEQSRTHAPDVPPLFFAHVRAATGTPVQETNRHPFAHGQWMFVHNGYVAEFDQLRRDMMLAVRPDLFPEIKGTTDSEVMFHLALTFGLEDDPIGTPTRAPWSPNR